MRGALELSNAKPRDNTSNALTRPHSPRFAQSAKQRRVSAVKFAVGELRAVGQRHGTGGKGAFDVGRLRYAG